MITRFDPALNREVTIISPGEYFACRDERVISTLLGSCVAVCLRDTRTGTAGMNHFMLAGPIPADGLGADQVGRYGLAAMELLIGEMIKLGSSRQGLTAKVFGGGRMFSSYHTSSSVPETNIRFVRSFLEQEEITLLSHDLGGDRGRRVLFFTGSGDVYVKKLSAPPGERLARQELELRDRLATNSREPGEVILFD